MCRRMDPCPRVTLVVALRPPRPADARTLQLLYTLTFWLLLRRFVKEKLLRKARAPAVLLEVAVADTGEWRAETERPHPGGLVLRPWTLPRCRAHTDADAAPEPGGAGLRHLCQVLDLRVRRHVHRGQLCRPPGGVQDRLHVPLPAVPHALPGAGEGGCAVGGLRAGLSPSVCRASRGKSSAGAQHGGAALRTALGSHNSLHLQVYYSLWRKLLKVFWWLVVAYTMLVLIAVYTFQFQDFPAYWRNLTGFTDEQ